MKLFDGDSTCGERRWRRDAADHHQDRRVATTSHGPSRQRKRFDARPAGAEMSKPRGASGARCATAPRRAARPRIGDARVATIRPTCSAFSAFAEPTSARWKRLASSGISRLRR